MTARLHIADGLALPLDVATETIAFVGQKGAGKTYGAGRLVEELHAARVQVVVLDPVGVWRGLRLAADGKAPGLDIAILGGDHGDLPLVPDAGRLVAETLVAQTASAVLDVSAFRKADRKKFVTAFAEDLFHHKKTLRSPLHLVIEEAQMFAPQKTFKGEEAMLGAFEDLVKLGRNYGIGVSLLTQRPQAVNKDILNLTSVLITFRIAGPHERKAIEGWIVEKDLDTRGLADSLPALKPGHAFVWAPTLLDDVRRVTFSHKRTFDASATPKIGAPQTRPTLAPLDVSELKVAMASVVERAAADDPVVLRRRIAELERELTAAKRAQPAAKVERVEVPVVPDAVLTRVRNAEEAADRAVRTVAEAVKSADLAALNLRTAAEEVHAMTKRLAATARPTMPPGARWTKQIGEEMLAPPEGYRHPRRQRREPATSNGDLRLGGGHRRILAALLQHGPSDKGRLAILAGYAVGGGGFNNYLSALKTAGFVWGGPGGYELTSEGLAAVPNPEPLPAPGPPLVDWWLSASRLGKAHREILRVLVDAHPRCLSHEEIAAATPSNYAPAGGGFVNALGRLRTLGLIEGRSELRAADALVGAAR